MKDPFIPSFLIPVDSENINIIIPSTDAQLQDQGYTYNQANFSFNEAGVQFGGVYLENQDDIPIFAQVSSITPQISGIVDIYITPNNQTIVGPGWFMYVAQV